MIVLAALVLAGLTSEPMPCPLLKTAIAQCWHPTTTVTICPDGHTVSSVTESPDPCASKRRT